MGYMDNCARASGEDPIQGLCLVVRHHRQSADDGETPDNLAGPRCGFEMSPPPEWDEGRGLSQTGNIYIYSI